MFNQIYAGWCSKKQIARVVFNILLCRNMEVYYIRRWLQPIKFDMITFELIRSLF